MYESNSQSSASNEDKSGQGRFLALDIGDKRIGMAVSDPLGLIAQGLPTLLRRGKKHDAGNIIDVIARYGVTRVVYGLPRHMHGDIGMQAEKTERFIDLLKSRVQCSFTSWDERLTSRHAEQALMESGISRKKRAEKVDMVSAVLILQSYLDYSHIHGEQR
ncbi:MAG: Holliday junction resolvase RuvX [bacterium]